MLTEACVAERTFEQQSATSSRTRGTHSHVDPQAALLPPARLLHSAHYFEICCNCAESPQSYFYAAERAALAHLSEPELLLCEEQNSPVPPLLVGRCGVVLSEPVAPVVLKLETERPNMLPGLTGRSGTFVTSISRFAPPPVATELSESAATEARRCCSGGASETPLPGSDAGTW